MASYFADLKNYSDQYQIKFTERLKLSFHYPFFKIIWIAMNSNGRKKKLSSMACKVFENYRFKFFIPVRGRQIASTIALRPDYVASYKEIFWGEEYKVKTAIPEVKTFVDLGANVGLASMYFYSHFTPKRILCVEGNSRLIPNLNELKHQIQDHCEMTIVNKCVTGEYSGKVSFFISPNNRDSKVVFGDCAEATATCDGISLRKLLDQNNFDDIDLLKMDIEGGEYDILHKDGEIFKRFRDILVEVHGSSSERESFRTKLQDLGFVLLETKGADNHGCEISHFRRIS